MFGQYFLWACVWLAFLLLLRVSLEEKKFSFFEKSKLSVFSFIVLLFRFFSLSLWSISFQDDETRHWVPWTWRDSEASTLTLGQVICCFIPELTFFFLKNLCCKTAYSRHLFRYTFRSLATSSQFFPLLYFIVAKTTEHNIYPFRHF